MKQGLLKIIAIMCGSVCILGTFLYGLDMDDGFGSARKIKGTHFNIYYEPHLDITSLIRQLDIYPSDRILAERPVASGGAGPEEELSEMVDVLFRRVCSILDMQLYSFIGTIKICHSQEHVKDIYMTIFQKDLRGFHSFYIYDMNTIYISSENFTRGILGHEIAHAVISHYFVVSPSVKIQEVLAGYTEFQLRKITE